MNWANNKQSMFFLFNIAKPRMQTSNTRIWWSSGLELAINMCEINTKHRGFDIISPIRMRTVPKTEFPKHWNFSRWPLIRIWTGYELFTANVSSWLFPSIQFRVNCSTLGPHHNTQLLCDMCFHDLCIYEQCCNYVILQYVIPALRYTIHIYIYISIIYIYNTIIWLVITVYTCPISSHIMSSHLISLHQPYTILSHATSIYPAKIGGWKICFHF